jgi:hypothetical protein
MKPSAGSTGTTDNTGTTDGPPLAAAREQVA